ncbi:hypothetical protein CJ030_MR3G017013 [Morella rubra]|uniref:Uncharacterized protein n=1 Tax=Morella rubra TaxID=262757 RepID=A0A6A1W4M0_9ROSI|nr:hypothetical protein CJ030_MR3G017013 [Morella rubra]
MKISYPLLENAKEIYTKTIFQIFQDEHEKANWVEFDSRNEEEGIVEYKVHNCVGNENLDYAMAKKHTITSSGNFRRCTYFQGGQRKKARRGIAQETMHDVEAISHLEKAARFTMYSNTFVGTISKYIDCEKTWKFFESAHKQLMADLEECVANGEVIEKETGNDCDGGGEMYSVGDEEILVRGLKKREVKYKSNKHLKSSIEKRRNVAKKKKTVVVEERRNVAKSKKPLWWKLLYLLCILHTSSSSSDQINRGHGMEVTLEQAWGAEVSDELLVESPAFGSNAEPLAREPFPVVFSATTGILIVALSICFLAAFPPNTCIFSPFDLPNYADVS